MKHALLLPLLAASITPAVSAQSPAAAYATCAACHAPDGKGLNMGAAGMMAPSLGGSKLALAGDGELLASIVFTGIAKEDAKFLGMMTPLGPVMKDEDLAAVITHIRSSFGNKASAVTADQVKTWRTKYNGKPMQKRSELEKQAAALLEKEAAAKKDPVAP